MNFRNYFSKPSELRLRMPSSEGRPDHVGILYHGPVLNGETTVESQQRHIAEQASLLANGLAPPAERTYTNKDPQWWLPGGRPPHSGAKKPKSKR